MLIEYSFSFKHSENGSPYEAKKTSPATKPCIELWNTSGACLIVEWPSGVNISNQTGGFECLQPEVEGVYIPLEDDYPSNYLSLDSALSRHFEGPKHRGTGATSGLDQEDLRTINHILQSHKPYGLFDWIEVDPTMLHSSHEAWVYVVIKSDFYWANGFGPYPRSGILTWSNSD